MYLIQFIPCHFTSSNNGLVGHNNSQIATLVNLLDSFRYAFNQFKIVNIAKEPDIFINCSITIKEDSLLLIMKILCLNYTILIIRFYLMEAFWRFQLSKL